MVSQLSTTKNDEKSIFRFPDHGPLDIRDYKEYLKHSKVTFHKRWLTPPPPETASMTDFEILQPLGSGTSAIVFLVRHKLSKVLYALKCIDKRKINRDQRYQQVDYFETEQHLLQCISHPFTIYLVNSFKDKSYIYFALPFVEGGDLHSHLKLFHKFDEDHAKFYASQVILALEYLHYLDLVYRDLKPENILIDHTGYLKLADFGYCKRLKKRIRTYTLCGTPEYMAPEMILRKGYGKAVDWWSFGIFIYELVKGSSPFVSDCSMTICKNIISKTLKFPRFFSSDLSELVDNLLQVDLSKRYGNLKNGVNDIKQHKWLCTINWLAVLNRKVDSPYKPESLSFNFVEHTSIKKAKAGKDNKYIDKFQDF